MQMSMRSHIRSGNTLQNRYVLYLWNSHTWSRGLVSCVYMVVQSPMIAIILSWHGETIRTHMPRIHAHVRFPTLDIQNRQTLCVFMQKKDLPINKPSILMLVAIYFCARSPPWSVSCLPATRNTWSTSLIFPSKTLFLLLKGANLSHPEADSIDIEYVSFS